MIAVDTNILIYAHREDAPWHGAAFDTLRKLGGKRWAIAWPCLHEFLAIVTHPKVFDPPTPMTDALRAVSQWLDTPLLTLLSEAEGYEDVLAQLLETSHVVGPRVHDARIAALCMQHGVDELWTADRDFSRFRKLKVRNPLH